MELRKSERKKAKIKLAIQGPSGSGKTMSSIFIAKGLTEGNLSKVAVIDTENGSADLYSHLGSYNVITMKSPYSPKKYIEAIDICEKSGAEVIIIDSISHCWDYLLQYHSKLTGQNSFKNWGMVTPKQNEFINRILTSTCHVICTMRTKQGYVINQNNGKFTPQKIGLKPIQRNDVEFEFTVVFNIDINHYATASKDRTGLFSTMSNLIISSSIGNKILDWCNTPLSADDIKIKIEQCINLSQVMQLHKDYPYFQDILTDEFAKKRDELENLTNFRNFN